MYEFSLDTSCVVIVALHNRNNLLSDLNFSLNPIHIHTQLASCKTTEDEREKKPRITDTCPKNRKMPRLSMRA